MRHYHGMMLSALAFLAGVLLVQHARQLPSFGFIIVIALLLLVSTAVTVVLSNRIKTPVLKQYITLTIFYISLICIGYSYAYIDGHDYLSGRMADSPGVRDFEIAGTVISLPDVQRARSQRVIRFYFDVHSIRELDSGMPAVFHPRTLRLSWYREYTKPVVLLPGQHWQLSVRLKPPHGTLNPGGFDYEQWLFQRDIHATGYVRKSSLNRLTGSSALAGAVDRQRLAIGKMIDQSGSSESLALIKALAVGIKHDISSEQWRIMTRTGTSHLMAISGLHIGLASLFGYGLVRYSVPARVSRRIPAQHVALVAGLVIAVVYAALAGGSVPTQRATVMLAVVIIMMLLRWPHRPLDTLGAALLAVLLYDCRSVLTPGFWFSFAAVAAIFLSFAGRESARQAGGNAADDATPFSAWPEYARIMALHMISILRSWFRIQFFISASLMPLTLLMFQQTSLVSPLANLVAIPFVSILVVPVIFISLFVCIFWPSAAITLFAVAASLLDYLWSLLELLSGLSIASWANGQITVTRALTATVAIIVLLLVVPVSRQVVTLISKHSAGRSGNTGISSLVNGDKRLLHGVFAVIVIFCSIVLYLTLYRQQTNLDTGEYRISILDVGQGLAIVVQTRAHSMVYDAGPRYSEQSDSARNVIIPFLRYAGISAPDRLLISHGDQDHIGGAGTLLAAYPNMDVVGQQLEALDLQSSDRRVAECRQGQAWHWDGVDFTVLSPSSALLDKAAVNDNNRSCVLKIASSAGSALLSGDIERDVELELLQDHRSELDSDVLLIPHHGSKTSSAISFLRTVNPEISIISAGYRNRYHHPSEQVLDRIRRYAAASALYRTDHHGAVLLTMKNGQPVETVLYRQQQSRYWRGLNDSKSNGGDRQQ